MSQEPYYNAGTTAPVVVRGVYVNRDPLDYHRDDEMSSSASPAPAAAMTIGDLEKAGEVQARRCNDVAFALLFWVHLAVVAGATATFAPRMIGDVAALSSGGNRDLSSSSSSGGSDAMFASWIVGIARLVLSAPSSSIVSPVHDEEARDLQEDYDADVDVADDLGDMILLLGASALIALLLSSLVLAFIIRRAESLIKFALLFNVVCTFAFTIGSIFISPFSAAVGIFLFVLTVYYAYVVWGRIPFAATNLVVAATAVKANLGLSIIAYSSLPVIIGWSCWWLVSFASTVYVASGCDAQGNCATETPGILVFSMLLSYHWTCQVIKNVVHVTVAGAVGTWWFVPTEGTSFCSHGVRDSFVRSITTSFGSICLGSLLVAIVEALRSMVRNMRENGEGGILLCLAECLLSCLQDMMEYFNMWAFVFVGLYGYPFVEAGKNVLTLFQSRGWTTIITDNLAQGVLSLVSVAVGLITGLIALAIAQARGMVFGDEVGAYAAAFFIGFVTGVVLTITLLTLVSSAVNTVIVCYAEAPREFELNHPKLSQDMRSAWRQAWPEDFRY
ncbi:hypothetical protein ACHAW5_006654 [Stephanodiscus triporus]|uniref:Choline transporter-like protein n=1 Tax=Stephanodiscus triporus TaxID=2934178 RepID=A0ABD3N559_9STRA